MQSDVHMEDQHVRQANRCTVGVRRRSALIINFIKGVEGHFFQIRFSIYWPQF